MPSSQDESLRTGPTQSSRTWAVDLPDFARRRAAALRVGNART